MVVALAGLAAVLGLLAGPAGAQTTSQTSGGALATNGSVASGCATAVDDSTASGANCAPVSLAVPPGGGGAGGGSAAGGASTGQLARTGTDLDAMALAAAATTALGGVFLALGRRRKPLVRA